MCKKLKISMRRAARGSMFGWILVVGVVSCGHASNYEEVVIEPEVEPGGSGRAGRSGTRCID